MLVLNLIVPTASKKWCKSLVISSSQFILFHFKISKILGIISDIDFTNRLFRRLSMFVIRTVFAALINNFWIKVLIVQIEIGSVSVHVWQLSIAISILICLILMRFTKFEKEPRFYKVCQKAFTQIIRFKILVSRRIRRLPNFCGMDLCDCI